MDAKNSYTTLQKARQEAARRQQEETEQLARQQKELSDRIKAGETTGDPVLDFVTVCWGGDEGVYSHLKSLQDSLDGMVGQCILTIETEKEWVTTGPPGGFGPSGYEEMKQCDVSFGLLQDEKLVLELDTGNFGFKTGRHSVMVMRHSPELVASDILFEKHRLFRFPAIQKLLEKPWNLDESYGRGTISVMAGNDNIFKWLDDWCGMSIGFSHDDLLNLAILLFCAPREATEPEPPMMPQRIAGWWQAKKHAIEMEIKDLNRKLDEALKEWEGDQKRTTAERHAQLSREIRGHRLSLEEKRGIAAKLHLDRCPKTAEDSA